MAHFEDLSPYAYGYKQGDPGVVHVGWLSDKHEYTKGRVPDHLVEILVKLSTNLEELYRGLHICELCERPDELKGKSYNEQWAWAMQRSSNGEIRITEGEVTYAAPQLIVHYILEHGYKPPDVFLEALENKMRYLESLETRI
jgi:hypothetical protein